MVTRAPRTKLVLAVLLGVLAPLPAFADPRGALGVPFGRGGGEEASPRSGTWVSLAAFVRPYDVGRTDVGAMAAVGVALDRLASHAARPPDAPRPILAWSTSLAVPPGEVPASRRGLSPLTREIARRCVAAAWRVAGLGADDARLDAIVSRARWSALLPETRLRATRLLDDRVDETAGQYTPYRSNLWLEGRLTFRLDRLLYVDEETSIERLRVTRAEARMRLAAHVLEELGRWRRAWVDLSDAPSDSNEAVDAGLRLADAEATLDVLTGGWFGGWRARASAGQPTSAAGGGG